MLARRRQTWAGGRRRSTHATLLASNLSTLISKITLETIGVSVSPRLFRTAGASTAAIYGGGTPYLAGALLDHRDRRVIEEDYNPASSMSAAQGYSALVGKLRDRK